MLSTTGYGEYVIDKHNSRHGEKGVKIGFPYLLCILLFLAATGTSDAAESDWPKEYLDLVTSTCIAEGIAGGEVTRTFRKAIERTCACGTKAIAKEVSFQEYKEMETAPLDKRSDLAVSKLVDEAFLQCGEENGLVKLLEEQMKLPIPQDIREKFLLDCAFAASEDARNLVDGGEKLAKACFCLADEMLPLMRTYSSADEYESDSESALEYCKKRHFTAD